MNTPRAPIASDLEPIDVRTLAIGDTFDVYVGNGMWWTAQVIDRDATSYRLRWLDLAGGTGTFSYDAPWYGRTRAPLQAASPTVTR